MRAAQIADGDEFKKYAESLVTGEVVDDMPTLDTLAEMDFDFEIPVREE